MATMLPLWAVFTIAGIIVITSYSWGRANSRKALRLERRAGYDQGQTDRNRAIEQRMRNGWRLVMNPGTDQPVWRGHYEGMDWPADVGEGDDTDTITAVMPGSQPTDESYRHQLAAIVADDAVIGTGLAQQANGCPDCHAPRLLTNGGPHCPRCGWAATSMTLPAPYRPRHQAAAEPALGIGQIGPWRPFEPHAGPAAWAPPTLELSLDDPPEAELEPEAFWLAVITLTAGLAIGDRWAAQPDPGNISYAALEPPAHDPAAELEAELEAEIDDYLANLANTDVWRLRAEAGHRAFCAANGLPYHPIAWEE